MSAKVAFFFGVKGSQAVEKAFADIGRTGAKELKEMRKAANDLSPAFVAVSRTVGIAKDKLDDLVQSSGNFGRVASAFGPMGIAAAVAFTAIAAGATLAFSKAKEAAEFADNLDDTAAKLGTTTDALQEYQFALVDAGGSADDAVAALDGFNVVLGKAQSGLGKGSLKPFAALGFTKAELAEVKVGSDLIPEIAERISKLGSFAEQAAVADKLGLKPMLPLLLQGRDGIEALKNKAHELGAVMDADLVKTGAEANKNLELTAMVIKTQLMTSFVNLAPTIVTAANALGEFAKNLNATFSPQSVAGIEARMVTLAARLGELQAKRAALVPGTLDALQAPWLDAQIDKAAAGLNSLATQRMLTVEQQRPADPVPGAGGTSLIDQSGAAAAAATAAEAAAAKSAAAAKAASDLKARQVAEDSRLIVSLMGEEERASYDLKKALEDLDAAKEHGNITSASELDRLKGVVQERYNAAKATREQTARDEREKHRLESEEARKTAVGGIAGYRTAAATPEATRASQVADLDAARTAAKGLKEELTDGEYENALKRINDQYVQMKVGMYEATMQGQLMNGVLSGQINSWQDLERFAIQALRSIIAQAANETMSGASGDSSLGGFFASLGKAAVAAFSGGRATGGPVYGGDRRWVGERGPEVRSESSDGFIYDAASTAAAMRSASPGTGGGGGAIGVTLNNHSSTPMRAEARETRDEKGNRNVEVTLMEQADRRIDARFDQMLDGKRDDTRLAGAFGVRRQLRGN